MKTLLAFVGLLLALTAKAAVVVLPISSFPNTNNLPGAAMFVVAVTNSSGSNNWNFRYDDMVMRLSNAIPAISTNYFLTNLTIFTNGGGDGLWMIQGGFASLTNAATNSIKISTNQYGILIGDTNRAFSYDAWPRANLLFLGIQDGSTGHTPTEFGWREIDANTNGGEFSIVARSGTSPQLVTLGSVRTNGVEASGFQFLLQKTGGYLVVRDSTGSNIVGFQNGGQLSSDVGPNHVRIKSHGVERLILSTNGAVSFFGSATNYGVLYAKSNFFVSGTTLLQSTLAVNGAALFLNGLGSQGITNTIGFQTLGSIVLGDDPADLTVSSNLFRQYGPMHIHDLLYLQNVGITPGELLYVTAGRSIDTVPGVNSTHAGYLAGLTEPISTSLARAVTNVTGTGGILVTSNSGNYNIDGSGISGGGGGGSSMWTNQATVVRLKAGSTNFVGGGLLNSIVSNSTYSTIAGGYNNFITNNSSFSAIGGGATNTIRTNSPFSTIAGGNQNHVDESAQYSTIAGGNGNSVSFDAYASAIGGGTGNRSAFLHGTVAGGSGNLAGATNAFVGGGFGNSAIGANSVIAGGASNNITGGSTYPFQTIGGGSGNTMIGATYGTVGGGAGNIINIGASSSTIAGGSSNVIQSGVAPNESPNSFIGGGYSNTVVYPGPFNVIGGGQQNMLMSTHGFIGSGYLNTIYTNAIHATIGGGTRNAISTNNPASVIAGGSNNVITIGSHFVSIGGGRDNTIRAHHATIGGGGGNTIATNARYAVIAGGFQHAIGTNAFASVISGGSGNTIEMDSTNGVIAGGLNNRIGTNSQYSAILGGFSNTVGPDTYGSTAIGVALVNTQTFAIDIGYYDGKVRIESGTISGSVGGTNMALLGGMRFKMTNGAANGALLTSDANGVATWSSGGGGGGGGGSGPAILSMSGLGTNTTFYGNIAVNTNVLVVTNGQVGIGTNTPTALLHVRPSTSSGSYFRIDDTNGTARLQMGTYPGSSDYGAIFMGNITTSSGDSATLSGNGNSSILNAPIGTVALRTGGNTRWTVASAGHLLAGTDNTYDIGASGATRPRDGFFGRNLVVSGTGNIRTNIGTMDVTTNLFVLGTRVTNGTRRIFVGASAQLSAAAAGTAKVTLYVENAGSATNRLSISAGPLASLITVEALFMAVSPGSIYYFTDETSGVGAAATLLPETCSVTAF